MSDSASLAELERIVANMLRYGVVTAVDLNASAPRVTVRTGGLDSDWLPWQTRRAGTTRTWSPPTMGEQVIVLAPGGDPSQAVVLPSFYQDSATPPVNSADKEHTRYPDGSSVEYDHVTNTLTVDVTAGTARVVVNCKEATVNATTSVTLDTPDTLCTGKLTVQGLLTYQAGMSGSGGTGATANITGNINVTSGEVTVDGIGVKSHHHTAQGASAPTTPAQP